MQPSAKHPHSGNANGLREPFSPPQSSHHVTPSTTAPSLEGTATAGQQSSSSSTGPSPPPALHALATASVGIRSQGVYLHTPPAALRSVSPPTKSVGLPPEAGTRASLQIKHSDPLYLSQSDAPPDGPALRGLNHPLSHTASLLSSMYSPTPASTTLLPPLRRLRTTEPTGRSCSASNTHLFKSTDTLKPPKEHEENRRNHNFHSDDSQDDGGDDDDEDSILLDTHAVGSDGSYIDVGTLRSTRTENTSRGPLRPPRYALKPGFNGRTNADGVKEGRGVMVYDDGAVFEGEWIDDAPHGYGVCYFPSGNVYVGSFVCGDMEGDGTIFFASGDIFSGCFSNSACHGPGVFLSTDVKYTGQWVNGTRTVAYPLGDSSAEMRRAHMAIISHALLQVHRYFSDYATDLMPTGCVRPPQSARRSSGTADHQPVISNSSHVPPTEPAGVKSMAALDGNATAAPQKTCSTKDISNSLPSILPSSSKRTPSWMALHTPPSSPPQPPALMQWPAPQPTPYYTASSEVRSSGSNNVMVVSAALPSMANTSSEAQQQLQQMQTLRDRWSTRPEPLSRNVSTTLVAETTQVIMQGGQQDMLSGTRGAGGGGACDVDAASHATTLGKLDPVKSCHEIHDVLFACSGPMSTEIFTITNYVKYLGLFLFPFLSLPHIPCCPLIINGLEMEREFVVSGAALRRDFDPPTVSIYINAVAMCCEITSIVLVACRVTLGSVQSGQLTLTEMVVPCILWFVLAAFCGSYNSYQRVAHPLERIDRHMTPQLTAHAASVVDSHASVCIYTWDDEGRGKVTNTHYRWRWGALSLFTALLIAFASPATRGGYTHRIFGHGGFEIAAALLTFFATLFFSFMLTYYVNKVTDMQRQITEQLRVLTRLAALQGVSITNPSSHLGHCFNFETELDVNDLFSGFSGWYVTRSLVIYTATCSNTSARSSAMSFFAVAVFCTSMTSLVDIIYCAIAGRLTSNIYYSAAHAVGLVVLVVWGGMLFRYLYVCLETIAEMRRHLYLMDIAAMYQRVVRKDVASADIITQCRNMVKDHDQHPTIFSYPITAALVAVNSVVNLCGIVAIVVQLGVAIYF